MEDGFKEINWPAERPNEDFTLAVAPLPPQGSKLTAYDFSEPIGSDSKISFGCDGVKVAQVLRRIADQLDNHEIMPVRCRVLTVAKNDDFAETFMRLSFHPWIDFSDKALKDREMVKQMDADRSTAQQ
jgi:hypothetical protein